MAAPNGSQEVAGWGRLSLRKFAEKMGVTAQTVRRWAGLAGVKRRGCAGVCMATERVGGRLYVTEDAYKAWQQAVDRRKAQGVKIDVVSPRQRRMEDAAVEAGLRRHGINW